MLLDGQNMVALVSSFEQKAPIELASKIPIENIWDIETIPAIPWA